MKIKTLLTVSSALGLAACFSNVLWTSAIDDAALTGTALPIVAQDNTLYQLYPVATQLHLRKLDSAGKLQWQIPVDESLGHSITAPKLQLSESGVVVGYQDSTAKTAFVKTFDSDGNTLWSSDLGEHDSEILDDLATDAHGSITVALRLGNSPLVLLLDSNGALLWEQSLANCGWGGCVVNVGVDEQNNLLAAKSDLTSTRSYLFDSNGALLWNKVRNTGLTTALGAVPSQITPSTTGFALLHPFVAWHFDLDGNETWHHSGGSQAAIATDAAGHFYIPGNGKISTLDSTGTLVSEIELGSPTGIRQIQWHEGLQRLITLTSHDSVGPDIDGTITAKSNMHLSVYDAAGVRKTRYQSKASETKSSLCSPYPQCTDITFIPGENWNHFTITADNKLVVSGLTPDSQRFAKAYRLF